MRFRLVEFLDPNIPYMLRNDGKLFEVENKLQKGDIIFHPYLLDKKMFPYNTLKLNDIQYYVFYGYGLDALDWYYTHTNDEQAKQEIDLILSALVHNDSYNRSRVVDLFNIDDNFSLWPDEIVLRYKNLNDAFNQEFCRVRFSGKYRQEHDSSIWFRISSVRFNWFNLIWKVVYDYRNTIDSVNICVDLQSREEESFYKINGKIIEDFPVDEFIMLKGNPVVESKNKIEDDFKNGKSFYESLNCNSAYQNMYYSMLRDSEEYIM